jgi:hypothetical protein
MFARWADMCLGSHPLELCVQGFACCGLTKCTGVRPMQLRIQGHSALGAEFRVAEKRTFCQAAARKALTAEHPGSENPSTLSGRGLQGPEHRVPRGETQAHCQAAAPRALKVEPHRAKIQALC